MLDKLIRKQDGKIFRPMMTEHWSEICSEDGEKDFVKWYGTDSDGTQTFLSYVSATRGFTYFLEKA